jgi:hypothetical protein
MDVVSFYCWSLMIVAGWLTALLSEDSHILLRAVTVINLWRQSTIFRYPVYLHVSFGLSCCRRLVSISNLATALVLASEELHLWGLAGAVEREGGEAYLISLHFSRTAVEFRSWSCVFHCN